MVGNAQKKPQHGHKPQEPHPEPAPAPETEDVMPRTIATGEQSFSFLRENNLFYIDKTHFIKE